MLQSAAPQVRDLNYTFSLLPGTDFVHRDLPSAGLRLETMNQYRHHVVPPTENDKRTAGNWRPGVIAEGSWRSSMPWR